jgi:hypothetical protein
MRRQGYRLKIGWQNILKPRLTGLVVLVITLSKGRVTKRALLRHNIKFI